MSIPMTAPEVLNREFLEIRAKLLELAAFFDRLNRAEGSITGDTRLPLIRGAIDALQSDALQSDANNLAEQVQLIFSQPYDDEWQKNFSFAAGRHESC
jgi:hypothetical protein